MVTTGMITGGPVGIPMPGVAVGVPDGPPGEEELPDEMDDSDWLEDCSVEAPGETTSGDAPGLGTVMGVMSMFWLSLVVDSAPEDELG